jgi:hypothetical protein
LGPIDEEGILYRYHPHYGFITNNTKQTEIIIYTCSFFWNSTSENKTVILEVERTYGTRNKPSRKFTDHQTSNFRWGCNTIVLFYRKTPHMTRKLDLDFTLLMQATTQYTIALFHVEILRSIY